MQETGCDAVKLEGGSAGARVDGARRSCGRGHPGDGAPRLHAAVGARARRVPGAGARRRRGAAALDDARRLEDAGAFVDRARARAGGRRGAGHARPLVHPDDRDRRRRGVRRPGARAPRPARPERRLRAEVPEALRVDGGRRARRGAPVRPTTCAAAPTRATSTRSDAPRRRCGRSRRSPSCASELARARATRRCSAAGASRSCRRWASCTTGTSRSWTRRGATPTSSR